jgi:hypothetical protein
MNKTRLGLALAAAASVALACGQGHIIFNVDIFSFMSGTGNDTITIPTVPATLGGTVDNPPLSVQLPPGLSNSVVDTVSLAGRMVLTNTTGSGTVFFQLFFAGDSASTYSGAAAISSDTVAITNAGTDTVHLNGNLTPVLNSLFTQSKVWIGIRAHVQAGATSITNGKLRLTALNAHVVVNDKFF